MLAHALQPLVIAQHALAQPRAEHLLQLAETLVAERLREAHQRRRLHDRRLRDAGRRAEGDLVGIVERIDRDLRQPLRQAVAALDDHRPQRLEIARGLQSLLVRHHGNGLRSNRYHAGLASTTRNQRLLALLKIE